MYSIEYVQYQEAFILFIFLKYIAKQASMYAHAHIYHSF